MTKPTGPRGGIKSPMVFRIHDRSLRVALENYRRHFEKRSGHRLTFGQVIETALRQFLCEPK